MTATPAQARSAFALRQQGLSLEAIAAALSLPESAVHIAIRRRASLITKEHAEQLRATELARIDTVWIPLKAEYDALGLMVTLSESERVRRDLLLSQLMRVSKWRLEWAPMPAPVAAASQGGGVTVIVRNVLPPVAPPPTLLAAVTAEAAEVVESETHVESDEPDSDSAE